MAIITLTTDFGSADHYVACMKGVILQQAPDVQIVDITHSIGAHDVVHGAFVLRQAFDYFTEGTIHIVVVDPGAVALSEASRDQLVAIAGDATRRGVLRQAGVEKATHVIITTDRDDSNVLVTLTVRQLNPDAWIVASVREQENVPLMRQSGANSVITSSDAVGRLLGLSSMSPQLGSVMEDLMTYGEGLEVAYDLGADGRGTSTIRLDDGTTCTAEVEAGFLGADMVVIQELSDPQCSDGTAFDRSEVVCTLDAAGGPPQCTGRQPGGNAYGLELQRES